MSAIVLNVAPIFILILIGWVIARAGILKVDSGEIIGEFVFRIAVPTLIFRTLAEADFHGVSPFRLWIAYFAGVAVTWMVAHLFSRYVFGRDGRMGVIAGISASFANNIFIGLPLVGRTVGDDGLLALSILLAIHLPVMMVTGTILMENANYKAGGGPRRGIGAILMQVGRNLALNSLVMGLCAGLLFNASGLPMPAVLKTVVDQISAIAGPAALLSLGMALTKYPVRGNLPIACVMTVLKLFLMPACVLLACRLLGVSQEWTMALVLTSSVPTGINAWLLANRFGVGHSLAASTVSISTACGILSVFFWSWLLH